MKPLAAVGVNSLVLLLIGLVVSLPAPSLAGTFVAFGPQTYVRPAGAPVTETRSVTVRNPNTSYTLRIHNGGLVDGEFERVASSVITLNGVQIVGPNEFNQTVTLLEKPITLGLTNDLAVQLRGQPGGGITLQIIGVDTEPPVITAAVDRPPNAAGWYAADVTVSFTCSDATSGVATCPPPVVVSAEGANQVVSGTAVDVAGNSASAAVTLNVDKTPPALTSAVTPAPNAAGWTRADTTVSFTATDALSGVASVSAPVTITTEGANQLVTGTAIDQAGNTTTASVAVSVDRTPPVLTPVVSPPPNAAGWHNTTVTVSFTAEDALAGVASVTPPVTVTTEGPAQVVTGTAIDQAGNQATASVTVSLDTTPPVVALTSPPNLSLFGASPVAVSGTVDDSEATVLVNGVPAAANGGSFTAPRVPLREGRNLLTAAATDQAGNVGTGSLVVTLDTTPPTVRIDTPSDRAILTTPQVTVTGMITDVVSGTVNAEQATVTVNGVPATIVNRSFLVPELLLVRGTNTITAVARDRVGNESRTQIQVTVQETVGQPRLERVSGHTQSGGISATLPEPLVVRLVDPEGRPVPGRPVTFTVIRTDGVIRALPEEGRVVTVPTDALGQARVLWQLGTRTGAGNNQVAVTSPGVVGEVVFCASATVGAPAQITVVSGEPQRGLVGAPLPLPFVAMVVDAGGNPVGGVPVTFTVEQGGGTLDGTPATTVTKPTDGDGRAAVILTLGEQEGITNQVVTAGFEGLTGARAAFLASSVVPGPPQDTRVSGVVLDNVDRPIPNATAKLVGTALSAVTDAQGQFTIPGVPVGTLTLLVDGRTSPRPETFPFLAFPMSTLAGQDNTLGMPIHLPPLDAGNAKLVGGDEEVVLLMTGVPGVAFTVFPHSATFPDGSTVGPLMLTQVPADKVPMPPPNGTAPRVVWTLQPGACQGGSCFPPGSVAIVEPLANTEFTIDAFPHMPVVNSRARIIGRNPDPTPGTTFEWTAQIRFQASTCPNGINREINPPDVVQSAVGGQFSPAFTALRGGALTLIARAVVDGLTSEDRTTGLTIKGTNPPRTEIQSLLPHDTLRKIACLESGQRQFDALANGGTSRCPLFSKDRLGGVGVMQLTKPAPTADEHWDWRANVQRGIALFGEKVVEAQNYPTEVRASAEFIALAIRFNQKRQEQGLSPVEVVLPDFSIGDFNDNLQQLELDAIRGYNGWPTNGQFGLRWHEFRVPVIVNADGTQDLIATVDPQTGKAHVVWEEVPIGSRPKAGDPDYVNDILRKSASCGG